MHSVPRNGAFDSGSVARGKQQGCGALRMMPNEPVRKMFIKEVSGFVQQVTCDMPLACASAGPGIWPGPRVGVPGLWQARYEEALGHLLLPDVAASVRSIGGDSILPTQVMTTLALSSKWDLAVAFLSEIFRMLVSATEHGRLHVATTFRGPEL
eukprot:s397_g50.t1